MENWRDIYGFWFGAPGTKGNGDVRDIWFGGGPSVDREIRRRFLRPYEEAVAGEFSGWTSGARSWISLIVLLDQFPRNIFRGDEMSFAADPLARQYAHRLIASPIHEELMTVEKVFAYLPLEHSEDIEDQEKCVALFRAIDPHDKKEEWIDFAVQHHDIIRRFGRFPHRNDILGRADTPDEEAWLASSDQRFGTVKAKDHIE